MATPAPCSALLPTALYLGDNGRATCGALACAGMTAFYSGRDLSGQRLARVTAQVAHAFGLTCEGCGMTPQEGA